MLEGIPAVAISWIKRMSIFLIAGALVLEAGNQIAQIMAQSLPEFLGWVIVVARFALISHLIEGLVAGYLAQSQGKNPLKLGVYTFFVGTVGLWEIGRDQD